MDECFIGGKEQNKHADKRIHAGSGKVGKQVVAGIKDRPTNRVVFENVLDMRWPTLYRFVKDHAKKTALVYTDDYMVYRKLPFQHEIVRHNAGEYVKGQAHTNGIESFWALLKRGYHGIYHHMSVKHLSRYITEFADKHDRRNLDTIDQMNIISKQMDNRRLTYQQLIA